MIKKLLLIFCVSLLLSGCSSEVCIDADDFGHAKFNVSSRYDKDKLEGQVGADQVGPWIDSNYRVNGRVLTVMVKGWEYGLDDNSKGELSAWCPWYGTKKDSNKLSSFCERLQTCEFIDQTMCTKTINAKIANVPCIFKRGVGLYALITKPGYDPNSLISTQKEPDGLNFHLGEPTSYSMTEIDKNGKTRKAGGRVYDYGSDENKREYVNGKLYFKILDKFYDDNNGQYRVVVKSGLTRSDPDPISYGVKLVKEFLFGTDDDYGLIRNIYKGVVNNPNYRAAVSATLTLYIMFTALSFLAGNIQLTQTEVIVRVGKIAIVSALLSSEYSWTFFNDYLFVYFIGGVEQILKMIMEAGATGPGSPDIISLMIAPETLSKLLSLLFVDWRGFIYIILFIIALYFVLMVFFEAAIIYLTALIAIGMIITMGPIFICFMLFGLTRSLFENWLKQLISYAVQPIILFTGLIFISMILRQEIYGALGFRICKYDIPQMKNDDGSSLFGKNTKREMSPVGGDSIFYWWFPRPMRGENFTRKKTLIPIPIDHFKSKNNIINAKSSKDDDFCAAYECTGERYIDLPFLDPEKDVRRINHFWNGQFVQLDGLLLIFVAIYLLMKFNELTVSIARLITGTSGNLTEIGNVGEAAMINTFHKSNQLLAAMPAGIKALAKRKGVRLLDKTIGQERREKLSGYTPSALMDKRRINSLRKDALSSNPNKAVLERAQRSSGLKQSGINRNGITQYQKALFNKLKQIDPALSDKNASKLASGLSDKKYSELKGEFAKGKFGKDYDKLSSDDKKSIDSLTNDRELRTYAKDAAAAKNFQEAYVDAYIEMSNQGISLFGKHNKTIRTLEELKYAADERQKMKKRQQGQTGEEIISKYEGLKSSIHSTIVGDKSLRINRDSTGGAWHEINTDPDAKNYRMQTHAEMIKDQGLKIERGNIDRTIEDLSRKHGENVTSPEFLAKATKEDHTDLSAFRELEKQNVESKVHDALSKGEDPALMGDTYMSKYANDSDMEHMIDRAHEVENDIMTQDSFIHRQYEYEETFGLAKEYLEPRYEMLAQEYPDQDITKDNMKELLQNYHEKNGLSSEDYKQEMEELQSAINNYHDSQEVLQGIDNRKMEISSEVDKYVDDINIHRTNAGMEEYKPEKAQIGMRKVRKIEDLKRGE